MTDAPNRVRDTREPEAPSWRVVSGDAEEVVLSGPGPCRSIMTVDRSEFDEWWEEIL